MTPEQRRQNVERFLGGFETNDGLEEPTLPPASPSTPMNYLRITKDSILNYLTLPWNTEAGWGVTGLMVVSDKPWVYGVDDEVVGPGTIFLFPGIQGFQDLTSDPPPYAGQVWLNGKPQEPLKRPTSESPSLHSQMAALLEKPTSVFVGFACSFPFNGIFEIDDERLGSFTGYNSGTCNIPWFGKRELPFSWKQIVWNLLASSLPTHPLTAVNGAVGNSYLHYLGTSVSVFDLCAVGNTPLFVMQETSGRYAAATNSIPADIHDNFGSTLVPAASTVTIDAISSKGTTLFRIDSTGSPFRRAAINRSGSVAKGAAPILKFSGHEQLRAFQLAVGYALETPYVIGLDTMSSLPYYVTSQLSDGSWDTSLVAMPTTAPELSTIAASATNANKMQVVGLGLADGYPYVAGYFDWLGTWHTGWTDNNGNQHAASEPLIPASSPLPAPLLTLFTVESLGDLILLGLGSDLTVYYVAFLDTTNNQWTPTMSAMQQEQQFAFSSCSAANDIDGNVYVFALSYMSLPGGIPSFVWATPTIVNWQENPPGTWHPGLITIAKNAPTSYDCMTGAWDDANQNYAVFARWMPGSIQQIDLYTATFNGTTIIGSSFYGAPQNACPWSLTPPSPVSATPGSVRVSPRENSSTLPEERI